MSDKDTDSPRRRNRRETLYRAYVVAMRVGLAVAAGGLALAIVLWPVLNDEEVSFTLSHEDVAETDDEIRMVNPRYVGRDARDRPFSVSAVSGVQDSPEDPRIRLTGISASLELNEQLRVEAYSAEGIYRFGEQYLELTGSMRIETSDGYLFEGSNAAFDIANRLAGSNNAISGSGPVGYFEAPGFQLIIDERRALFDGGVKMRIDPTGRNHRGGE